MPDGPYYIPTNTPGRLAILPRPRGGDWLDVDVAAWKRAGNNTVVSLLTPQEDVDLKLGFEMKDCESVGIEFHSLPIPDRGIPSSRQEFTDLSGRLANQLQLGKSVGIHCRQGIGRSGMLAISMLGQLGIEPKLAVRTVSAARDLPVPETPEQLKWITADEMKQVNHRLVTAINS